MKKKSPKKNPDLAPAPVASPAPIDRDEDDVLEDNLVDGDLLDDPVDGLADTAPDSSPAAPLATRYLEHILTPAEIDEKREERERGDVQREKLEMDLATAQARVKDLKTQIEALDAHGRELSRVIRAGVEYRDVECREERAPDWRKGEPTFGVVGIVTVRCDTDEPLEWRPLTKQERQGNLFDEAGAQA